MKPSAEKFNKEQESKDPVPPLVDSFLTRPPPPPKEDIPKPEPVVKKEEKKKDEPWEKSKDWPKDNYWWHEDRHSDYKSSKGKYHKSYDKKRDKPYRK